MIVSLSKLEQLIAVGQCGSLSRAAEALNISQPALSRNVAFIEGVYGVKLFDRTSQGVVPTEAGAAIIAEAERLTRTADTFDHNAKLIGGGKLGFVAFGMGPILADALMGRVGIALIEGGKRISIRAQTRRADYLIKALLDEDLELGIVGNIGFALPDEIEARPMGFMRTAAISRPGHPLANQQDLSFDQIREYPVASPVDLNGLWAFHPVPHNISCDDSVAMKEMVVATNTVCFCASLFARKLTQSGEVVTLDVKLPAECRQIEIVALTIKGRARSPAVDLVIRCCREMLQEEA